MQHSSPGLTANMKRATAAEALEQDGVIVRTEVWQYPWCPMALA